MRIYASSPGLAISDGSLAWCVDSVRRAFLKNVADNKGRLIAVSGDLCRAASKPLQSERPKDGKDADEYKQISNYFRDGR